MKKRWIIYVLTALLWELLITGCTKEEKVYLEEGSGKEQEENRDGSKNGKEASQEEIVVYVCGAVKKPGVYELGADPRVCDALEAAGGFTEDADKEALNQAELLSDGQMLRVLTVQEAEQQKQQDRGSEGGQININTADIKTLMQLPGIGESKAEAILAYREEHGGFQSTEELMQISGIKEGVYNKIKKSITVN